MNETKAVAKAQPKITDLVMDKLNLLASKGKVSFPKDYNVENALQSAWLVLQETLDKDKRPVLQSCTRASIANALFDMALMGLNPAKKQCYPIAYGKKLSMTPSYFGVQTALRRIGYFVDAMIIYKGDKIEIATKDGKDYVKTHESPFENRNNEIIGAYGVVKDLENDKIVWTEIMTMEKIIKSWSKSKTYGRSDTPHALFPDQMAKRTVIVRAAKQYVNTRDDKDLLIQSFNRSVDSEYKDDDEIEDVQDVEIDATAYSELSEPKTIGKPVYLPPSKDESVEAEFDGETEDIFNRETERND